MDSKAPKTEMNSNKKETITKMDSKAPKTEMDSRGGEGHFR